MNTDFKNGKELLEFCEKEKISISRSYAFTRKVTRQKKQNLPYTHEWKLHGIL